MAKKARGQIHFLPAGEKVDFSVWCRIDRDESGKVRLLFAHPDKKTNEYKVVPESMKLSVWEVGLIINCINHAIIISILTLILFGNFRQLSHMYYKV